MKTLKAYEVHDGNEGWCIRFATNSATARREGANELDADWESIEHCRRKPTLDQYAPGPVPPQALIDLGWWFECFNCGRKVSNDLHDDVENDDLDPDDFEIVTEGQRVYCCQACVANHAAKTRANQAAQNALIELMESKFPGATPLKVHVSGEKLEPHINGRGWTCAVTFRFPGGKNPVQWVYGEDFARVMQEDAPAFSALYRPQEATA